MYELLPPVVLVYSSHWVQEALPYEDLGYSDYDAEVASRQAMLA